MRYSGRDRVATLAQQAFDLKLLKLPDATCCFRSGRELIYRFVVSPSPCSRLYTCVLRSKQDDIHPDLFVVKPDLFKLTGGRRPPHIYPHNGVGTKLCLYLPGSAEWRRGMKLTETYIPWAGEWLWYFEDWLSTGIWAGGGEHPYPDANQEGAKKKRTRERQLR